MSEYREVLRSILVNGTPDQCIGCHTPFLHADHLTGQVLEGEITEEAATAKLKEETESACRYGRRVIRAASGEIKAINCMAHSIPSLAGMESPPPEFMNWNEWLAPTDSAESA